MRQSIRKPAQLFAVLALAGALAACVGSPPPESAFVVPDDCFNLAKHDHPNYVDSCGNEG